MYIPKATRKRCADKGSIEREENFMEDGTFRNSACRVRRKKMDHHRKERKRTERCKRKIGILLKELLVFCKTIRFVKCFDTFLNYLRT